MNLKRAALRRQIITLALIPSIACSIFVIAAFCLLYGRQIDLWEQQKFGLAEQLAAVQGTTLTNQEDFDRLALALLAIEPLRRVTLYDGNKNPVATAGLPGKNDTSDMGPYLQNESYRWSDASTHFGAIPLFQEGEATPYHWLLIELDGAHFSLLRHQVLIALLVLSFLALFITVYFARRLQKSITEPLARLRIGVDDYLSGSDHPIAVGEDSEFQDLADAVTKLVEQHQREVAAVQQHVDEQTQDLRESLETVEIQNIELDMARKSALQSSRAKSEFLANASHELRTPLNGILGFSNLLLKTELTDQQTDYVSTIEQSAQGLLTVINDILDISRLETGDLTLEYKPVLVTQIIDEVLKMQAPSAHEKKLRLITLIDPHVPDNLLGDPQRLKQVITNLISNAVKFSDKGSIVTRVSFLGETDNQVHLKFAVADNGIGLSREQQEGLFDSFSPLDTADNRLKSGTGLGLAIAKGLVQRMHGEIGVESTPGHGSTFWFSVRLGINTRATSHRTLLTNLTGIRALVYDSHDFSRLEVTHLLHNWGVHFIETNELNQVEELVERQAQTEPISIVILDAQLRENVFDQDSLRCCVETLNHRYHLPVVILAQPNICRMLQTLLDKLQAVAVPRPISHQHLYRTICSQLGISAAVSERGSAPAAQPTQSRTPHVLAVDDNAANLRLVSELLNGMGCVVVTASSGEEALSLARGQKFDLVLMDIQMPGMDGLETTRQWRKLEESGQRVPIVALTAHAVNEQKTRLLVAGMDDYLSKPVSDADLRHAIERWTQAHNVENLPRPPRALPPAQNHESQPLAVVDLQQSLEKANHKPDLARDLLTMLLASLDESRTAISRAAADDDNRQLMEIVHKLHGGCCYCGVPALASATERLHRQLQKQQFDRLAESVQAVLDKISELQMWAGDHDLYTLFESTK